MAEEGAIRSLIELLDSSNELTQRQSAKALANLGVSNENKPKIAAAGGIPKLIRLAGTISIGVRIEAIAALANLAVNGKNNPSLVFVLIRSLR
jgi:HEAT repeat protein